MNAKKLYPVLLAAVLVGTSGWSLAAEGEASTHHHPQSEQGTKAMPGMNAQMMGNMGNGMMGNGMMGNGMMGRGMMGGMMGMMGGGCPMMGRFPTGDEALAMRMHGEMMEAMGKILVKYADKIKPQQSK
ncbi:MAG TPA: hypothetical protein VFK51_05700 [Burkholderiales bacterium]|jgi:hypothetical protein|nr:hypothetical protein [Burkholderiales bacterium]